MLSSKTGKFGLSSQAVGLDAYLYIKWLEKLTVEQFLTFVSPREMSFNALIKKATQDYCDLISDFIKCSI